MYSVSEISKKTGIARSTLLYYEKINIIKPSRDSENDYRIYSEKDLNRLILLKQFQKAGFSIAECSRILDGSYDEKLIKDRFISLEQNLSDIMMARDFLKSIYIHITGEELKSDYNSSEGKWHAGFEKVSSEAHEKWLLELGLDPKEANYVRWVSRDIGNNKTYMKYFFEVFENMKRQGPGSKNSTLKAFNKISDREKIKSILEIGCGKGETAINLAGVCDAEMIALDNHQPFLDSLNEKQDLSGYNKRIKTLNMDMRNLAFDEESFDLIWSEGSAYFVGFEKALKGWKKFLKKKGYLFVSDAVWISEKPSKPCKEYWETEYPSMCNYETRIEQAKEAGYEVIFDFPLPRKDWNSFYNDMEKVLNKAVKKHGNNKTFSNLKHEIETDRKYGKEYSYICLLLRNKQI